MLLVFASTQGPSRLVAEWLDACDVLSLRLCCRATRDLTEAWKREGLFTTRVRELLGRLLGPDNQHEFCSWLLHHQAVLRGSTLLKALVGGAWEPKDLDVFCQSRPHFGLTLSREGVCTSTAGIYSHLSDVEKIETCRVPGWPSIEIVHCRKPPHEVEFDLAFLNNSFDGRGLVLENIPSLRERASAICFRAAADTWPTIRARIVKYESRGFRILVEEEEEAVLISVPLGVPIPVHVRLVRLRDLPFRLVRLNSVEKRMLISILVWIRPGPSSLRTCRGGGTC